MSVSEQEKNKIFNGLTSHGEKLAALEVRVEAVNKIDKRMCVMEKSMRHLWWRMGLATGGIVVVLKMAFTYIPQG